MSRSSTTAALLLLAALLLAYLPDVGHGFVSDDFTWIVAARDFLHDPSLAALLRTTNFLRPLVTLSFAFNWSLTGAHAAAYGAFNLVLVLACAGLIFGTCRLLALSVPASLAAAAAWSFNFHGINMAILWISGRTSLLLTFFALLTAVCTLRRRIWLAAVFCALALFSKEEALALPFILAAWFGIRRAWPLAIPLLVYLAVRVQTAAFWPSAAPDYYRFTTDIGSLILNAGHYLDRGGTVFALTAVVLLATTRVLPRLGDDDRRNLLRGVVWFAGGYGLTVWVPVRSSLYAVFPSVGMAIVLAVLAHRVFATADSRGRMRAAVVLVVLPFLLWPVYRARNVRWVELAELTSHVLPQLAPHAERMRAGVPVWIEDDDSTRANVRNAFGGQMDNAVRVHYSLTTRVEVSAPGAPPPEGAILLRLRDGQLVSRTRD